jgi:hypothetical protein
VFDRTGHHDLDAVTCGEGEPVEVMEGFPRRVPAKAGLLVVAGDRINVIGGAAGRWAALRRERIDRAIRGMTGPGRQQG